MPHLPAFHDYAHGITCIDTELIRPGLAACYLIQHEGMAGFVDTGVNSSVPGLLQVLEHKRIPRENVAWVMPTHVHLDHAGGAGLLLQELPAARLLIHPRGARHMIDPTQLSAGATAVYGKQAFQRMYGELVPVAESRISIAEEGFVLDFNGRSLRFLDTPGHARHHYCIHDAMSAGLFTGDTFGASYPELNTASQRFIFPPTTPIQFDPDAWAVSLQRLMGLQPERIYVTHYGKHENPAPLYQQLLDCLQEYVALAAAHAASSDRVAALQAALLQSSINRILATGSTLGSTLDSDTIGQVLDGDMRLNAQGLDYWLNQA
ncbi:MAG: MBL fold metallo-hydrolase [Pseudomonadales bacterium]|nr:MBL fold metallo-hydrolase [Pseudomonadales bacterium]